MWGQKRTGTAAIVITAALAWVITAAPALGGGVGNDQGSGPSTVYLALGDSAAWGDGASVPAHTGYVPRLAGYFHGTSHGGADTWVDLAVRGEHTTSFLTPGGQLDQALDAINAPSDIRAVTISIGGNDLLDLINDPTDECVLHPGSPTCQAQLYLAMQTVATNLPVILGSLQAALAADPGTQKVFVLLLWNPFGGTGSPFEAPVAVALRGSDLKIDCPADATDPAKVGLDDIIACTALAAGAIPVDMYPLFDDDALALTHIGEGFNIHPNDDGYALIAWAHRMVDQGKLVQDFGF